MMGKFKQTLLTEEAYLQLKEAKEIIEQKTGRRTSFTEVIKQTIGVVKFFRVIISANIFIINQFKKDLRGLFGDEIYKLSINHI